MLKKKKDAVKKASYRKPRIEVIGHLEDLTGSGSDVNAYDTANSYVDET